VNSNIKTAIFWVVLICVAVLLWTVVRTGNHRTERQITFTEFLNQVEANKVKEVTISGNDVHGIYANENAGLHTLVPTNYPELYNRLQEHNVNVDIKEASNGGWVSLLVNASPFILLLAFWIFMMRQMQSGGNKALSFGKSRARLHSTQQKKVTFKDVAGVEEAKEELQEIIEFLREPQKFQKLGGRIPKGVLLIGPPGTGKTLLARAIAGEASVPFFSISGSDFVEMFVGVGASRVRDLFEQGKKNAPCIIFIDEIDAVGRHRGAGLGGGHDEREQTLNQLLVEMDGFEANEGVILVAATNRPDVLDPALLRPGRFDRRVVVPLPDVKGREGILKVHTRKVPLSDDVDASKLSRSTPGFAGADLENLVNEAALLAARRNKDKVEMSDFELAKDKVMMGAERRSMVMSGAERKIIAYHEGGHALVAMLQPGADPVHKVTIIPRGMALGVTQQLPMDDRYTYPRDYLVTRLAVMFGGRTAEELVFGQMTTGAGNDIEKATELARKMVCEWGMSKELGPMTFGRREEQIFLGRDIAHHKDYSEQTALEIDREVRRIIDDSYHKARQLLSDHLPLLHAIAARLLEKEVLDGVEVEAMVTAFKEGREMPPSPAAVRNDFPPRPGPDTGKEKRADDESAVPGLPPKPVLA
jgi:cell division protease FtsH